MLGNLLDDASDDWWLIGGAAFLAHGIGSGQLNDIDVLLSMRDAAMIADRFDLQATKTDGDGLFRSKVFYKWHTPPVPVEFMVGLEVFAKQNWQLVELKTRESKNLGSARVFVPVAVELVEIDRLFGREKDLVRASTLEKLAAATN